MKKLGWVNKIVFILNMVLIIATFFGYLLPYFAPKFFPIRSVLTLFLPVLLIGNFFFFAYWMIQFKRQSMYSMFILLIGITYINKFYKFNQKIVEKTDNELVVMSYNVRLFNLYKWIKNENVSEKISAFIKDKNPDIICLQEYSEQNSVDFKLYPEKFVFVEGKNTLLGHGIYSKFPIINKGKIDFNSSSNNAAFVDIRRGIDTIRVYSLHLESIKITPDVHEIDNDPNKITEEKTKRILNRIGESFITQQKQAEIIKEHATQCKHPIIITGDINNSAFSYVYRIIKGDKLDAFEEAGHGFGKSYNIKHFPLRIDYIFTNKTKFSISEFNTYNDFVASDHFPIVARLTIN